MSVQAADGPVRALLVEGVHPVAAELLSAAGVVVETERGALGPEELAERLQGVHVLGIRSRTHLTSSGAISMPAGLFNGSDGCESTGAISRTSVCVM